VCGMSLTEEQYASKNYQAHLCRARSMPAPGLWPCKGDHVPRSTAGKGYSKPRSAVATDGVSATRRHHYQDHAL
jgi:hypothetical protein